MLGFSATNHAGKVCAGGAMEVAKDDMDIVSALRQALADRIGQQRFEMWFGSACRFELNGTLLVVYTPTAFFQQWLAANFRGRIEQAAEQVIGRSVRVEFRVDSQRSAAPAPSGQHQSHGAERASTGRVTNARLAAGTSTDRPAPAGASGRSSKGRTASGGARRYAELSSFIVGPSNRMAQAAADEVVRSPGLLSPLTIYGPTSVGKTHLLEGIYRAVCRKHRSLVAVYLSAEQFTVFFLEALRGSGLPSFRRKYRTVDLLIIDDMQFFCGKRCTQLELFHTVDALLQRDRQIVLAADRPPSELKELGPELIARLESGMVCRIDPPDYKTRVGIVGQMARQMQLELPEEVVHFVASRLTNHARELSGAVCRLHAASRAWQQPVTLPMAEKALADLIRSSTRLLHLGDIERAVCETFGLNPKTLHTASKSAQVSHPRMLAMWLARKYTRAALSEISRYFGRRSHATVISAERQVNRWLAEGKVLRMADQSWRADEAVEQLERRLKTG